MKTILVPVDLSGATVRVCNAAAEVAQAMKGRLVILHVVPPPPMMVVDYYAFDTTQLVGLTRESRKVAVHKMEALGRWFRKRCPATRVMLHDGVPVQVILRTAKTIRADYIVLGSHGHTATYDLLIGSTTHGALRKATCPVIVVPISEKPKKRR